MKTSIIVMNVVRMSHVVVAGWLLLVGVLQVAVADETEDRRLRIAEKSRDLHDRMTRRFHEQWHELRESVAGKAAAVDSLAIASVDLRERHDGYTLRAHMPGRDVGKVEVVFEEGKTLRITAPAEGKLASYEQKIVLEGVAPDAKPLVRRRAETHVIVVDLPKAAGVVESSPKEASAPPSSGGRAGEPWDRLVLGRMEQMRREMDRMCEQAFEEWDDLPGPSEFFDRARFGAAVDLKEEAGSYVVRAYLPERNAENAKVMVEKGRLRIVAASEDSSERNGEGLVWRRKSEFVQIIDLPGPVDAAQLKIERKEGLVIVTLPKAK